MISATHIASYAVVSMSIVARSDDVVQFLAEFKILGPLHSAVALDPRLPCLCTARKSDGEPRMVRTCAVRECASSWGSPCVERIHTPGTLNLMHTEAGSRRG